MPNRTKLYINHPTGIYRAVEVGNEGAEFEDIGGQWLEVSGPNEIAAARLQGEWLGKGVLPRDLCKKGTEHGEQAAWFAWAAANVGTFPDLAKAFAIPNGGLRDAKTASMMKAEGVRSGIPDVLLPKPVRIPFDNPAFYSMFKEATPVGSFRESAFLAGLWLEFKRKKKGRLSSEQVDRIEQLRADGYAAIRVNGWIEARDATICYLTS